MAHLLIWTGPASKRHAERAVLPPRTHVLGLSEGLNGGQGSSAYERLGETLDADELVRLSRLDPVEIETFSLAAFSAGWGLVEHVLRADAAAFDVVLAADAYYTAGDLAPKRGYRQAVDIAVGGNALVVFTTTDSAGETHPSSHDAVAALLADVDLEPRRVPPEIPAPARAVGAGGLLWLHYGGRGAEDHRRQATMVAPAVLSHVVTPYLRAQSRVLTGAMGSGRLDADTLVEAAFIAAGLAWMVAS